MPFRLVSARATRLLAAAASLLVAGACFDFKPTDERPGVTDRDGPLDLSPGDVRIVTTDGQFEMAVVGQQVVMRLSDAGVERVRGQMSRDHASGGTVSSWIERKVKDAVQDVLDKQMQMPVASIDDARYENGEIRLIARGEGRQMNFFGGVSTDRKGNVMTQFAPADAERFVAAVRAAKGRS